MYLVFLLCVLPILASVDAYGDLLGQELDPSFVHIRERRQAQHGGVRPLSQAPSYIQQLLHAQSARGPLSHIPAQPAPQLSSGRPSQPQHLNQGQVSQYRPQVQYGGAPQQPTYKSIQPKVVPLGAQQPHQPQYRPAAANYPQQAVHNQQPNYRGNYRPIQAPQAGPQPHYSSKLPPQLQQLVQLQHNLANSIPGK